MENAAVCGSTWREWFAKLSQDGYLWKITQCSLFEDLEQSLEIWPRSGLMLRGQCFPLPNLERPTSEKESGSSLPTPTATDWRRTPIKRQYAERPMTIGAPDGLAKWALRDSGLEHGRLVPDLWEWAMGWPKNWARLKPLEMDKFQEWQQQHSPSWPNN